MGLTYDPELGVIVDETGKQVASLQPGPERDGLGRQMAAAPLLVDVLQQSRHALYGLWSSQGEPYPEDERGRAAMRELRRLLDLAAVALFEAGTEL